MLETVSFPAAIDGPAAGALAVPPGDLPVPAVILVHEWWGLNDQMRGTATRLASEGFLVLAIDLYRGVITRDPVEAQRLMTELPRERSLADLTGAVPFLKAHPRCNGKVAIMGMCMGGAYAFAAACFVRGLVAAVPFYGIPPKPDWSQVDVPILCHVASRDGWVKPELAEQIQQTLATRGQRMDLHVYDADHAFMNEQRPEVYSAEDARVAWDRTVDFLHHHGD
ncbi:MAG: dienelactone hydrolase family protein [Kofleriaceae bacterium]